MTVCLYSNTSPVSSSRGRHPRCSPTSLSLSVSRLREHVEKEDVGMLLSLHKDFFMTFNCFFIRLFRDDFFDDFYHFFFFVYGSLRNDTDFCYLSLFALSSLFISLKKVFPYLLVCCAVFIMYCVYLKAFIKTPLKTPLAWLNPARKPSQSCLSHLGSLTGMSCPSSSSTSTT